MSEKGGMSWWMSWCVDVCGEIDGERCQSVCMACGVRAWCVVSS